MLGTFFPQGFLGKVNKEIFKRAGFTANAPAFKKPSLKRPCLLPGSLQQQNERVELGPYFINYVKVGSGPNVVFCFPGILGNN